MRLIAGLEIALGRTAWIDLRLEAQRHMHSFGHTGGNVDWLEKPRLSLGVVLPNKRMQHLAVALRPRLQCRNFPNAVGAVHDFHCDERPSRRAARFGNSDTDCGAIHAALPLVCPARKNERPNRDAKSGACNRGCNPGNHIGGLQ